jgi:hypothetical protein
MVEKRIRTASAVLLVHALFGAPKDLPPGKVAAVTDSITLPMDIPAGVFDLALAVVDGDESPSDPVVRLGIKGRDKDGWYPLSRIRVGR